MRKRFALAAILFVMAAPAHGQTAVDKPEPGEGTRLVSESKPAEIELLKRLREVIESLKGQPLEPGCLEG